MKKLFVPALAAAMLLSAVCLYAADFWAKPYTEWNEKDVQKMLTNSPWAKQIAVSMNGGGGGGERAGGKRGGGSNGRPGTMGETGGSGGGGMGGNAGGLSGSGAPGSAGRADDMEMAAGQGQPAIQLLVIWESAVAVKEAWVKKKYGSEASSSEEGKKYIERDEPGYVVSITIPQMGRGGDPSRMSAMKDALKESAALNIKGKDPIKATQVDMANGKALFVFPKSTPITADDKEVEFTTKLNRDQIKCKFDLKHMTIDGKLAI